MSLIWYVLIEIKLLNIYIERMEGILSMRTWNICCEHLRE